jgi:hypothetical protein
MPPISMVLVGLLVGLHVLLTLVTTDSDESGWSTAKWSSRQQTKQTAHHRSYPAEKLK